MIKTAELNIREVLSALKFRKIRRNSGKHVHEQGKPKIYEWDDLANNHKMKTLRISMKSRPDSIEDIWKPAGRKPAESSNTGVLIFKNIALT
jgi:hypothetical protein